VQVRSMGAACRMYPLHLDAGTARCWTCQPSRLYPAEPGVDAAWRIDDEMRSDGLWKGRSGGIGYAARDMAQQIKREDPALRRKTREREEERERREREHARVGDARVRKTREREEERENTREWETRV
jgi:hypothetical protein